MVPLRLHGTRLTSPSPTISKPSLPPSSSFEPQLSGSRSPRAAKCDKSGGCSWGSVFLPFPVVLVSGVLPSPFFLVFWSPLGQLPGTCSPRKATKPVAAVQLWLSLPPLPRAPQGLSSSVPASSGSLTGAAHLSPSTPPTRPASMAPASRAYRKGCLP